MKLSTLTPQSLQSKFQLQVGSVVDDSFWVELHNYLQHARVRDRSAAEQELLAQRIYQLALRLPGQVGGGDVRQVTFVLCSNPFSDCDDAADVILNAAGVDSLESTFQVEVKKAVIRLQASDEQTLNATAG